MSPKKVKTTSEGLFEKVCADVGIGCTPVDEGKSPTPDYELDWAGHRVVAEVKQFDPNDEEAESLERMEAGGISGVSAKPGHRIRKAIGYAAPQLKALSKGASPAMVVVYNNSGAGQHTDPYSVATAMQGFDVVPVLVPEAPSIPPQFQDARSGPIGRKMRADANTTISAVGVLRTPDPSGIPHLLVYHNRHARNPIDPDWGRHPRVKHLRLRDGATSSLDEWVEV